MRKLIVLTALALALGTAHQAVACDYGPCTEYPTAVNVEALTRVAQPPMAKPETAAPKVTREGSGCASDDPVPAPSVNACGNNDGC